ncbi:MAG: aconitase X [Thermoplasmata archaeon]|jgi:predicted aconitase/predicted aconitase with swiveling domain
MEELRTRQQISWLDDVDEKGVIVNPNHDLFGKSLAGATLYFPSASGSTVGSDRIVNLAVRGFAPKRIVLERTDPITLWGAILGKIEIEVRGVAKKAVDRRKVEALGIDEEIVDYLVRAGELLGTDEFIPAEHVQIAGVSYKTITETGLDLRRYFGGKYRFRSPNVTINPAGMDLEDWRAHGIPEEFARKQQEVVDIYVKMGAIPTVTCTPYLIGNMPAPFVESFLSESSVVAFANSVLGVRTNRESGLSTLLYAIAGYGPRYGLHLPENRHPRVEVAVECELHGAVDFSLLGYALGELVKGRIPYLTGFSKRPTLEEFKVLSAAGAASGSIDLFHIEDITPEAKLHLISRDRIEERFVVTRDLLNEVKKKLNTGRVEDLDLVTFGCPHASLSEVKEIATLLAGKKVRAGVTLWVCTSRAVKDLSTRLGYVAAVETAGGYVVADTCMVVSPIEDMGHKTTATNSGKAAKYLPRFCHQNVVFDTAEDIIGKIVA